MLKQRTIKKEVSISGVGLHSGQKVNLKFKPAPENSGINFIRTDLEGKPAIKATIDNVVTTNKSPRRTSIGVASVEVQTVEHLMAALCGLNIDNLNIEIDNVEVPGLDGSALNFIDILRQAGLEDQNTPQKVFKVREPIWFEENDSSIVVLPYNGFKISYTLDYYNSEVQTSFLSTDINSELFVKEIAASRTFCLEEEAQELRAKGLGQGANYSNTLVIGANGVIDNKLRFKDEFIRHKVLDLIGDFYLFGPMQAHILALKSGHSLNTKVLAKLNQQKKKSEASGVAAPSGQELNYQNPLEAQDIIKILPHRYPFLLVDRILSLEPGKRAVGLKNVTMNEQFFTGHFPGKPVMPGVLIIEAMAQVGGVIMLSPVDNRGRIAYFMAADKVKFRRPVVPGDQLVLEVEVVKVRSRAGQVRAKASVDGKPVSEAELMFSLSGD